MINIIDGLDRSIFEPYVLINREGNDKENELRGKGVRILINEFDPKSCRSRIHKVYRSFQLGRSLRSYKFSLWQSFDWSSDWSEAVAAKIAGAKYIYVKKNMNWNRKAWKIKSLFSYRVVVRNTDLLNNQFSKWPLKNRAIFITGGVDIEKFKPSNKPMDLFRQKFGIKKEEPLIVSIAQLSPIKGQHLIIEALLNLEKGTLIIAGNEVDPDYAANLKGIIGENRLEKRVIFLGFLENVPDLINEADLYILATTMENGHEEGCPVSLLEAMASGKACIASDVAGSRDLIKNGETGLLFKPGDANDLKSKIELLLDNKDQRINLGCEARVYVSKKHSLPMEQERFSKLYRELSDH